MGADPIDGSRQGQDEGKSMAWLPAQRWPKKIPAFYEPRVRPTRPMCRTSFRERAMLIETLVTGFVVTFVLIVAVGHVLLAQAVLQHKHR